MPASNVVLSRCWKRCPERGSEHDRQQDHTMINPMDALVAARGAQAHEPFPAWPLRAARLRALEALIRDNRDSIVTAISADFGRRPAEETELLEIFPSISSVRHALKHGRRWMRPRRRWAQWRRRLCAKRALTTRFRKAAALSSQV